MADGKQITDADRQRLNDLAQRADNEFRDLFEIVATLVPSVVSHLLSPDPSSGAEPPEMDEKTLEFMTQVALHLLSASSVKRSFQRALLTSNALYSEQIRHRKITGEFGDDPADYSGMPFPPTDRWTRHALTLDRPNWFAIGRDTIASSIARVKGRQLALLFRRINVPPPTMDDVLAVESDAHLVPGDVLFSFESTIMLDVILGQMESIRDALAQREAESQINAPSTDTPQ